MGLTKYKLGELIELCETRNDNLKYGVKDVKGISIQKEFIETKYADDRVAYTNGKQDMINNIINE